jgi:hypothetical protein
MNARQMRSARLRNLSVLTFAVVVALTASALPARASSYAGRGDTGDHRFIFKSECCAAARSLAEQDGARACRRTGGFARESLQPAPGGCQWNAMQTPLGVTLFRCTSTTSVGCQH